MFDILNYNCTTFDGTTFSSLPSTSSPHTFGAMTSAFGYPYVLGGEGDYNGIDTDVVEYYDTSKGNIFKIYMGY